VTQFLLAIKKMQVQARIFLLAFLQVQVIFGKNIATFENFNGTTEETDSKETKFNFKASKMVLND